MYQNNTSSKNGPTTPPPPQYFYCTTPKEGGKASLKTRLWPLPLLYSPSFDACGICLESDGVRVIDELGTLPIDLQGRVLVSQVSVELSMAVLKNTVGR